MRAFVASALAIASLSYMYIDTRFLTNPSCTGVQPSYSRLFWHAYMPSLSSSETLAVTARQLFIREYSAIYRNEKSDVFMP